MTKQNVNIQLLGELFDLFSSTSVGEGGSRIGVEDAGAYFAGIDVQAVVDEILLGGGGGGGDGIHLAATPSWSSSSFGSLTFGHSLGAVPQAMLSFITWDCGGSPPGAGRGGGIGFWQNNSAGGPTQHTLASHGAASIVDGFMGYFSEGSFNPPTNSNMAYPVTGVTATDITINRSGTQVIGGCTVLTAWYLFE